MLHEPETFIDRQFRYLRSHDGAEFFLQARRCMAVLKSEPRVAALLEELREEALALDRRRKDPWAIGDKTRSGILLNILHQKIGALRAPPGAKEDQRPDLEDLSVELI